MPLFPLKKSQDQSPSKTGQVSKNVIVFDFLSKLGTNINQFMAIYLYTSKLQNQNINSLQRQGLIETFTTVIKKTGGELFSLPDDNTLIVFTKTSIDEIKSALVKTSFLFYDDPLMKNVTDIEKSAFTRVFDLPDNINELKNVVLTSMRSELSKQENFANPALQNTETAKPSQEVKKLRRNLSPDMLSKLQTSLERTDFSSLIRRQSICAIIGKATPHVLFDEIFVSVPDLRDTFLPDVDLIANPWLFQVLTETLDKGVLTNILRREDSFLNSHISLNLNVETILSDIFLEFDNTISPQMRATVVLELQIVDILSDIKAYNLAKTFAQSRGYKICIDGITSDKIKYINQSAFEADFIKLIWAPNLKEILEEDTYFYHYENKSQRSKFIICRVDDEEAIKIGNELGINIYQGRYVQKLLAQQPRRLKFDLS